MSQTAKPKVQPDAMDVDSMEEDGDYGAGKGGTAVGEDEDEEEDEAPVKKPAARGKKTAAPPAKATKARAPPKKAAAKKSKGLVR